MNIHATNHMGITGLADRFFDRLCSHIGDDIDSREAEKMWQSACDLAGVDGTVQSVSAESIEDLSYHLELIVAHGDADRDLMKVLLKNESLEVYAGLDDIPAMSEPEVITLFLGPDLKEDYEFLKLMWSEIGQIGVTADILHARIAKCVEVKKSQLTASEIQETLERLHNQNCLDFENGFYSVNHGSDWWLKDTLTYSYGAEWKNWFSTLVRMASANPFSCIPTDKRKLIIQFSNGISPETAFKSISLGPRQQQAANTLVDSACKATGMGADQLTSMRILHVAPSIFRRKDFKGYDLKITSNDIPAEYIAFALRKSYANKHFTVATASAGITGLFIPIPEGKQSITLTYTWLMEGGRKTVHNVRYIFGRSRKNAWLFSEVAERHQSENSYTPAQIHPYAFFELSDFALKKKQEESWEEAITNVPRMKHSIDRMQKFNNFLTINETIFIKGRHHSNCWEIGL